MRVKCSLGRSVTQQKQVSPETAQAIDAEVRNIIDRNYNRAKEILKKHKKQLKAMADALMKYETIDRKQIINIMEGREPGPPEGWHDDKSNKSDKKSKSKSSKSPIIGGPASEH